jgi:thioredoxin reductase
VIKTWDAVVVGAGPAGLSAAYWLARYRRRTLVLDDARPRNEDAWAVHGYPGLRDVRPAELRRRLQEQATEAGALIERRRVARVSGEKGAFLIEDGEGDAVSARRVVLAYGRTDRIPEITGLKELYGTSVFHCPDCDGPSVAGCDIGVLGHDRAAATLALYLLTWATRTVLLTNGLEPDLNSSAVATLDRYSVEIERAPIERLEGADGSLASVRLAGDRQIALGAVFFHWGSDPAAELARETGCDLVPSGDVVVNGDTLETSVQGIYAAGDIVGRPHLAISAAAEGVRAALSIHRSLLPDDFEL